jgi:hypothetical protein
VNEPRRLLEESADQVELALLRADLADVPPRESMGRTLSALGVGAGVGLGAGSASATASVVASKITVAASAKWIGAFIIGGTLAIGAAKWPRYPDVARSEVAPAVAAVSPGVVRAPADTVATDPAPAKAEAPHDAIVQVVDSSRRVARAAAPRASSLQANPDEGLADQIGMIDRARRSVASHDPNGALVALDDYQRQFPRGALAPEAAVLRIEALAQQGDRSRATVLARKFLAAHPKSPQAARLRSLLPELVSTREGSDEGLEQP